MPIAIKHNIDEKVIVSMTSWKKRINQVESVIRKILSNTIVPDKIILNLSTDEFTHKENDLPQDLLQLTNNNIFEIYWVKENTKPYKKTIPTLERFPNDIIITIDDDIDYPVNFIETLLKYYVDYGKQCPITSGTFKWNNCLFSHYGGFSLIKKEFVGECLNDLYQNLVLKNIDKFPFADPIITYAILLNGKRYRYTNNLNMSYIRQQTHLNDDALSKRGTSQYENQIKIEHKLIQEYIYKTYHKTYDDLVKSDIIVNCTTYPCRDKYLYETLKSIQKQLVKPTKIILHLSLDEYDPCNLPMTIKKCITDKLLTNINFINKNTYCHKRYALFDKNSYAYNIIIDDDIRYNNNFIQELMSYAYKNQDSIIVIASHKITYTNYAINIFKNNDKKSINNAFMGGCTCFPPYSLPIGAMNDFNIIKQRDAYVKKCDEGWIRAFLYKYGIHVVAIHNWFDYKFDTIEQTQSCALYNENKQVKCINDLFIREKERNFFNAVKIVGSEEQVKQIFPTLNLNNWNIAVDINDYAKSHIKNISKQEALSQINAAKQFDKNVLHISNIDKPCTMTEKIRYVCTYGILDDLKCMCADKLLLHDFSKHVLGFDICIPIIKIIDDVKTLDMSQLPDTFVLKANHGCKFNLIYDKPSKYSIKQMQEYANKWLATDISTKIYETHYNKIIPKIYVEQYMNDGHSSLVDYKFLCFNGKPKFCQIINDRHTPTQRLNYYDMDFKFIDICRNEFKNNPKLIDKKPRTWNQMIDIATKLSSYFDLVRVDLYEINEKVYLGELTFTPGAGKFTYKNPNDNIKLGKMLNLTQIKM